jgi:shikimate dehydrogenase
VIGDPIRHSLSPAIFNAAFAAAALDWVFVALPVVAGNAPAALDGMRALQIDGLSVTMPHKTAVADAVDELTDDARALHAVNHVRRDGIRLLGDNTDGPGFLAALRAETGFDPRGTRCVVLGAGGAARAVILALARAGADEVAVVNRTAAGAETAAGLAGAAGRVAGPDAVNGAALVVNATSVGMEGSDLPLDPDRLTAGTVVADLVYQPLTTPLVLEARRRGCPAINGLGMLVHQAAAQFTHWTGDPAPLDVMLGAVTDRLGAKAPPDQGG